MIPAPTSKGIDNASGWKTIETLIGVLDDAPADIAEHHDDYLGAWR